MNDVFCFFLGAACVSVGQLIGWRLAVLEARATKAPPPEREPTYREAAPAPEVEPRCEWSAGGGEFCGEPCGPEGLCFRHQLEELRRQNDEQGRAAGEMLRRLDRPPWVESFEQRVQRLERSLSVELPRDRVTEWPGAVFRCLAKDARGER